MSSTPLIASSSGVATVSAMTLGLAPGYCARTTTDGGTTSGYSEIGSARSAIRPASSISSDSTPAKIGRSMKNLDRFTKRLRSRHGGAVAPGLLDLGLGVHRDRLRRQQRARPYPVQAVDDDALAGLQAAGHDAQPVDRRAQRDLAPDRLVVVADHDDEALALVGADRALVDEQRAGGLGLAHLQAGELARHERAVLVVEHCAHAHGAALRVDLVVD